MQEMADVECRRIRGDSQTHCLAPRPSEKHKYLERNNFVVAKFEVAKNESY